MLREKKEALKTQKANNERAIVNSDKKIGEHLEELLENIKKGSLLPADLLEKLIDNFSSLNGLGQLVVISLLSNSIILICIISIVYTIFGDYLINRFNLEEKYPSLSKIIRLRTKFQKYYLISNITIIILMCLVQIIINTAAARLFLI